MPRYIIERNMSVESDDLLQEMGRLSIQVADEMGIHWVRSYYSEAEGKFYCEYEAADAETVREHARRVGLPVDRISEVSMEVDPSMFR